MKERRFGQLDTKIQEPYCTKIQISATERHLYGRPGGGTEKIPCGTDPAGEGCLLGGERVGVTAGGAVVGQIV